MNSSFVHLSLFLLHTCMQTCTHNHNIFFFNSLCMNVKVCLFTCCTAALYFFISSDMSSSFSSSWVCMSAFSLISAMFLFSTCQQSQPTLWRVTPASLGLQLWADPFKTTAGITSLPSKLDWPFRDYSRNSPPLPPQKKKKSWADPLETIARITPPKKQQQQQQQKHTKKTQQRQVYVTSGRNTIIKSEVKVQFTVLVDRWASCRSRLHFSTL